MIIMEELFKKIYELKPIKQEELQAVKQKITADFIMIENDYKKMPKSILTKKGVFDLVGDFEKEANKESKITGKYAFSYPDKYNFAFYMTEKYYEKYVNSLISFLLTHKKILVEYINLKYKENITINDILADKVINNLEVKKGNIKWKVKRNKHIEKKKMFIKYKDKTLLIEDKKVYLIKKEVDKNELCTNVSKRKYRGNDNVYKNERDFRVTAFM